MTSPRQQWPAQKQLKMMITKKQTEEEEKEEDIEVAVERPQENVQIDLLLIEQEEPLMADPWEKTKTKMLVLLPSVQRFLFPGMEIHDEQGQFVCKLFAEGVDHFDPLTGPMYFAIFVNAEDKPMALMKRNPLVEVVTTLIS
jgi:hypothetical protein